MKVCIDTNVLVQIFGRSQSERPIRDALQSGQIELAVSDDILLEYEETISRLSGPARWREVEQFFTLLFYLHSNILFIDPHFHFGIISVDPDDNKFVDCAIAAQAIYIITSDRDFSSLVGSGYKPQPITPAEFIRRHL